MANIIHQAECEYFTNTLQEHKHQPREIFRIYVIYSLPLSPGYTDDELATMFNNFFITKIAKIREVLESTTRDTTQTSDIHTCIPPKLATFKVLTCQDVKKITGRTLSNSSDADPIPIHLVKEALP